MCPCAVKVAELRQPGRAQGSGRGSRRQQKVLVAVKHMKQNEMSSFEDCAEFDDECALLRKLRHRCTPPQEAAGLHFVHHLHDSLPAHTAPRCRGGAAWQLQLQSQPARTARPQ